MGTITKRLIGMDDVSPWDGTSDKTFTALSSTGKTITLNKFGYDPDYAQVGCFSEVICKDKPTVNVKAFGASGSYNSTTGTIGLGSTSLTLAAAKDFMNGQGICVAGAGAAGANLFTTIVSGEGTVNLVLAAAAATAVVGATVVHDDTVAIQAAIDSITTLTSGVFFPNGYYLTRKLTLSNLSCLYGVGQFASVLALQSGANDALIYAASKSDLAISGLTLYGNYTNQTVDASVVDLTSCVNIHISNCQIHDGGYDGVNLDNCSHISIVNCIVKDNVRHGVHCESTTDTSTYILVSGSRIYGQDAAGSYGVLFADAYGSMISGNVIEDNDRGIGLLGVAGTTELCVYNSISSNTIVAPSGGGARGISIDGTVGSVEAGVVDGNSIMGDWAYGIYMVSAGYFSFGGNAISGLSSAGAIGVYLDTAFINSFVGHSMYGIQSHAFSLTDSDGNVISTNSSFLVAVDGASDVFYLTNSDRNIISNNVDSGGLLGAHPDYGVYIDSGSKNSISNNIFTGVLTANIYDGGSSTKIDGYEKVEITNATAGAVGGAWEDLHSFTLPASAHETHRVVRFRAAGAKTGAVGTKSIRLTVGSSTYTVVAANNDTTDWVIEGTLTIRAQTDARLEWLGRSNAVAFGYEAPTVDFSGAQVIKLQGNCANAADSIVQYIWLVESA